MITVSHERKAMRHDTQQRSPDAVFLLSDGVFDGVTHERKDAEEHQQGAVEREEENGYGLELQVRSLAQNEDVKQNHLRNSTHVSHRFFVESGHGLNL